MVNKQIIIKLSVDNGEWDGLKNFPGIQGKFIIQPKKYCCCCSAFGSIEMKLFLSTSLVHIIWGKSAYSIETASVLQWHQSIGEELPCYLQQECFSVYLFIFIYQRTGIKKPVIKLQETQAKTFKLTNKQ